MEDWDDRLAAVKALAASDLEAAEADALLKSLPVDLRRLKTAREEADAEQARLEAEQNRLATARAEAQKRLATLDRRIQSNQRNAQRVTTAAQMEANEKEARQLAELRSEADDQEVELALEEEENTEALETARRVARDAGLNFDERYARAKKQAVTCRATIAAAAEARPGLAARVNPSDLATYQKCYQAHPDSPTCRSLDLKCLSCHTSVPPQAALNFRSGRGLTRCRGCGRLLIGFDKAEPESEEDAEDQVR